MAKSYSSAVSNGTINQISLRKFNAFCYVREPRVYTFSKEVDWYSAFDDNIIATIVLDLYDNDYGYVILCRDLKRVFRPMDIAVSYKTKASAKRALLRAIPKLYKEDGVYTFPQGDEKKRPNEFLTPLVPREKLHPIFKYLIDSPHHEGTRELIKEIVYSYVDVDGNYIKDFQTTGFDARLWELFLYMYLYTSRFSLDNSYNAPDYVVSYYGLQATIEAVTVNPSPTFDEPAPKMMVDVYKLCHDYMPIKFGSSLTSKLNKKYWEKEHVKGKPFILAIHDYHIPASKDSAGSMTWTMNAISDYLYGVRIKYKVEDEKVFLLGTETTDGVKPILEDIDTHIWKNKTIPSNFFGLTGAENVSGVLFSASATIATFNRMAKLSGLGDPARKLYRTYNMFDPTAGALLGEVRIADLDNPDYEEAWEDGLFLFHNPNALHPINPGMFPGITHIFFDRKERSFQYLVSPNSVVSSLTTVAISSENADKQSKYF